MLAGLGSWLAVGWRLQFPHMRASPQGCSHNMVAGFPRANNSREEERGIKAEVAVFFIIESQKRCSHMLLCGFGHMHQPCYDVGPGFQEEEAVGGHLGN